MPWPLIYRFDISHPGIYYRYADMSGTTNSEIVLPDVGAANITLLGIGLHFGPHNDTE